MNERPVDLLDGYPVVVTIPVRWGDMDAYAHLNNTVYFQLFESARIAYFERMSVVVRSGGAPDGVGPILATTSCRFRAPVKYPDTLRAAARVVEIGDDRLRMEYAIASEALATLAAIGDGTIVSFDYGAGRKVPVPPSWRDAIERIETKAATP